MENGKAIDQEHSGYHFSTLTTPKLISRTFQVHLRSIQTLPTFIWIFTDTLKLDYLNSWLRNVFSMSIKLIDVGKLTHLQCMIVDAINETGNVASLIRTDN